jgi:hypothetical protein
MEQGETPSVSHSRAQQNSVTSRFCVLTFTTASENLTRSHSLMSHPIFLLLQLELFTVLVTHPPPLISLTLNNVIAMPHKIYTMEAFQPLVGDTFNIRSL